MIDPLTFRSPLDDLPDEPTFRRHLRRVTLGPMTALGAAIMVLLALVIFLLESARVVERIDLRLGEVVAVEKLAVDMETSVRGFQLTADERFLQPWDFAAHRLESALATVQRPSPGLVGAQEEIDRLDRATRDWENWAWQTIELRRDGFTGTDVDFELKGKELMDKIREATFAYISKLAAERAQRARLLRGLEIALTVGVAGGGLLFGLLAVLWLSRLMRRVGAAYERSLDAATRQLGELRVLLQSIGDAVMATDTNGRVLFLNPVAEQLTGWTSDEARGRPIAEVFVISNEETGKTTENPIERVLREGIVVGLANHTVLKSRKGQFWPIEDSAAPIRSADGELRGVILVFHDVSERRAQDRRLRASEERLRFLNDLAEATRPLAIPAAIMEATTRLTGQFMDASRCAYAEVEEDNEHFEIPHDYTDGCASSVGHFRLSDFGPRAANEMRTGRVLVMHDVTRELRNEEGAAGFASIGVEAIICYPLVKAGRLHAMMAVHQTTPREWTLPEVELLGEVVDRAWVNIERARTEAALRWSEEQARLALQAADLGAWDHVPANGEMRWNDRCRELFGFGPGVQPSIELYESVVHPEDRAARKHRLNPQALSRDTGRFALEFRIVRQDGGGEVRHIRLLGQALFDEQGQVRRVLGTLRDITEERQREETLRAAKEQAESASRAKDNFLAALSHELRTPLTPALLTTAALRQDMSLPASVRADLASVQRNVELEARLIDDLLDLTRIARGKLPLRPQECDVHSLIGLAAGIVSEESRVKEQKLRLELGARRSSLTADPARLQQLFWNLLRNAVKFTPVGGHITVRTRDLDHGLQAEVVDSGVGLAPGVLDRIFQPFEQVGYENDHRFGGLGLGLAIARAIVDLHGGTIRAESAGPGRGAVFIVELPGAHVGVPVSETESQAPAAESAQPAAESGPRRLLLVEDNEATLEVLARLLRKAGHDVTTATDVRSGLAAAKTKRFDGVISDLGLPDGTGLELMEELRDEYGLRGIALTGYGMDEDLRRTREAGFVSHLIKPIDFDTLRQAMTAFGKKIPEDYTATSRTETVPPEAPG